MIVDDDPSIIIAIRELFEKEGYHVYTVTSGTECIQELEEGFKGVILLDIMMPIMDGWETIKEIVQKDLQKGNIITILTAKYAPDSNIEEYKEYIKDYITKPFNPTELINIVHDYYNDL